MAQQYLTTTAVPHPTGAAVATLPGDLRPRKLVGISITGVSGSRAEIYLGALGASNRIDSTSRGQSNTADYSTPRNIPPGAPVLVAWPGQSANAAQCSASFTVDY